jgi:hypothetical protein
MDNLDNRTNSATAQVVNQGIEWQKTYGSRSAAAFLAHRHIPRAIIRRVVDGDDQAAVRPLSAMAGAETKFDQQASDSFQQPIHHTESART